MKIKAAHDTFLGLGVNLTNILQAVFGYKSILSNFSLILFGFLNFWRKNIGAKATGKMLVKL